ncbi:hypothetical protein FRC08_013589 [Ceratobasidium sp. 394]|nr:hypothetical protein FRC08_013589 [Ceratobasidium sp. 394]
MSMEDEANEINERETEGLPPLPEATAVGGLDFAFIFSDFADHPGTYDEYLQQKEEYTVIPGPQLPTDPIDAIYDDHSGDLSCLGDVPTPQDTSKAKMGPAPQSPLFKDPFNQWGAPEGDQPVAILTDN